jgi:hypothetical protein
MSRGAYTRMPMLHPLIRIVQQVEARDNQQTGRDLLRHISMAESHYRTSCDEMSLSLASLSIGASRLSESC